MPRSRRPSWAHSAATATVVASSRRARSASPVTARAVWCIVRRAREVPGVGHPVEVPGVEHDEPAGGVEDVDGADVAGVGVPGRGGEDGGQPGLVGEAEQGGGVGARPGGPLGAVVVDDLDGEGVGWQQGLPGREPGPGDVTAPEQQGPADVGVGAEEDEQPARRSRLPDGMPGEERGGRDRGAPLATEMGVGDEASQGRPAPAVGDPGAVSPGEQDDAGVAWVDGGPAAHRAAGTGTTVCRVLTVPRERAERTGLPRQPRRQVDSEVDPEHRGDPDPGRGRREPDRSVEPVAVGEGEGGLALLGRSGDEGLGRRGAVAHREARRDVEVDEPRVAPVLSRPGPAGGHGVPAPPWAGRRRSGWSAARVGSPSRAVTRSRNASAERSRSSASRRATRRRPCSTSARCRVEWAK